jgi:hypothetical protein
MAYPKNSVHPKLVGDRTTAQVLARLLEFYDSVFIPFGENQRYDLLVEDGDAFIGIQCKTGRLVKGSVIFNACSFTYHHPARQPTTHYMHHYRGQADYFGIYCAATDGVYLIRVDDVGVSKGSLRVDPTKNGQSKRVKWARHYELKKRSAETSPGSIGLGDALPLRLG